MNSIHKCALKGGPATSRRLLPAHGIITGIIGLWLIVAVTDTQFDLRLLSVLLLSTVVTVGWLLLRTTASQWSAAFLCFLPLAIFHVGLFVQPAITGRLPDFVESTGSFWFVRADHNLPVALIAVGLSAFGLGTILVRLPEPAAIPKLLGLNRAFIRESKVYAACGASLLVGSVLAWFVLGALSAGPLFFLQSYGRYLDATEGGLTGVTYIGIGIGLTLTVQNTRTSISKVGIVTFICFAMAGYPLGLRGEVLMPGVAAIIVYMCIREDRPRWLLLVGSAVILLTIPVVKELRKLGIGQTSEGIEVDFNFLEGIEEMGASARVVYTSVDWHVLNNESFRFGETYYTYGYRILRSLLGLDNIPARLDYGLMNVEVSSRVGNIGGSLIAEAHHNFGLLGVVIVPLLLGLAVSIAAANVRNSTGLAFLGLVTVCIMMHVRNTFGPLLLWAVVGVAVIVLAKIVLASANVQRSDP